MDPYEILRINEGASQEEIRKAYKIMVLKYHPDKNLEENSETKFKEVKMAYEILSNSEKRKEYDDTRRKKIKNIKIFDLVDDYFMKIKPEHMNIYNFLIKDIYHNKKDDLKNDLENFEMKRIFKNIINGATYYIQNKKMNEVLYDYEININEKDCENEQLKEIKIGIKDIYENKEKIIKIIDKKNNKLEEEFIKCNFNDLFINNNPFIINKNKEKIKFIVKEKEYKINKKGDIILEKKISLSQYIYGGESYIDYMGENIKIKIKSQIYKPKKIIINDKGLYKNNKRQKLIIKTKIEGIDKETKMEPLEKKYSRVLEETIKIMFPEI